MESFCFASPTVLYHGRGCVAQNASALCAAGQRALLVTGRSGARVCGALADVTAALDSQNTAWELFDRVEENPSLDTCAAGAQAARAFGADFIIAIGGGSALDASKAVAVLARGEYESPGQIFDGLKGKPLPVIAVPTTAGTGSEVNAIAVITVEGGRLKRSMRHNFPETAFADPGYLEHLPKNTLVSCALDAFCHCVESLLVRGSNPMSEMLSLYAIRLLFPVLRTMERRAPDSGQLDSLSLGASLGGMAIQMTGTAMPHPMGYNLTLDKGVPHGAATAVFLPYFIERCDKSSPHILARITDAADALPDEIAGTVRRLHGVSLTLDADTIRDYVERIKTASQFRDGYFAFAPGDIEKLYLELFGN